MPDSVHAIEVIQNSCRPDEWPRIPVHWSVSRRHFFNRKYTLERYVGCVMLAGFAPAIGALWLLVRATSRGPGFYRQVRVGLNGECFELVKLRSMKQDAERKGEAIWCQQADQRVTLLGKALRKLHLDELPQLWNVAKGEMSIVGPRPERPSICEKLAQKIDGYYDRTLVKPGISGLSQINLPADQCLDDVQRKQILDLQYINETSHWFEFRILLATALRIVGVKGETIIKLMRLCRRSLIEPTTALGESTSALGESKTQTERKDPTSRSITSPNLKLDPLRSFLDEYLLPSVSQQVSDTAVGMRHRVAANAMSRRVVTEKPAQPRPAALKSDTGATVANCMTIDVEDYFQVSAFSDRVTRSDWSRYECRVEANTNRVLNVLDEAKVRGTFFVLGWIAERYPALVRRIAAAGHELASHGYWHQLVYDLTPEQFANDVIASREAIYNACGVEVTSYRAPSFSIVPRSRWALDVLAELGFKSDSSVFPMSGHDRYGDPDAPKHIHSVTTQHGDLIEVPPTLGYAGRVPVPIGGGYFRLFPLGMTQHAIAEVRNRIGPAMFYLHPWELDPEQPRVFSNASRKNRFRHYVGLKRTEEKLRRLLRCHPFDTMGNVIQAVMPPLPASLPASQPASQAAPTRHPLRVIRRRKSTPAPANAMPTIPSVSTTIHR